MTTQKEYTTTHVSVSRLDGDFHFEALGADKVAVHMDAAAAIGGTHQGARPMELLLMGLGGCAGVDVVLILKKGRQNLEHIRITIEGKREKGAEPAPFEAIHMHFSMQGDLVPKRVEDAIRLSITKYCSAAAMLSKTADITWSFDINGEPPA